MLGIIQTCQVWISSDMASNKLTDIALSHEEILPKYIFTLTEPKTREAKTHSKFTAV